MRTKKHSMVGSVENRGIGSTFFRLIQYPSNLVIDKGMRAEKLVRFNRNRVLMESGTSSYSLLCGLISERITFIRAARKNEIPVAIRVLLWAKRRIMRLVKSEDQQIIFPLMLHKKLQRSVCTAVSVAVVSYPARIFTRAPFP